MQWNRHDEIDAIEQGLRGLRQPAREQAAYILAVGILVAVDKQAHGATVARHGAQTINDWRIGYGRCR